MAELPLIQAALGAEGWYLSTALDLPALPFLLQAIEEQRLDDVETYMVEFARTRIDPTLDAVGTLWPHRKLILSDAIAAHREERFGLSIPVLLAQADSICYEMLSVSLFTKKRGVPETKRAYHANFPAMDLDDGGLTGFYLRPLELLTSLNVNTPDAAGRLNRHAVLHGHSVDYPSEANGLRAIMVLDYLSDLQEKFSRVGAAVGNAETG